MHKLEKIYLKGLAIVYATFLTIILLTKIIQP